MSFKVLFVLLPYSPFVLPSLFTAAMHKHAVCKTKRGNSVGKTVIMEDTLILAYDKDEQEE